MKAIEIIRIIGTEFASVSSDTIVKYIEIFRPMVSRKQFGTLYEQGVAYLVMHKMKMAGLGVNPLGKMGDIGVGFAIGSVSEGGSSVSFGANQSSNLATDAELALTKYGVQYIQLRRSVIVPIHIGGEEIEEPTDYDSSGLDIIPAATRTTLGGVKVRPGSGLILESDGELRIDPATNPQTEHLFDDDVAPDPDDQGGDDEPTPKERQGVIVMPGSGLILHEDGRLEIDRASDGQVEDAFSEADSNG